MAFVPNSGAVSTDIISDVFGLGDDFNNYRGTIWYYPANLMYGYFSSGTIKSSDFYGKQPTDPATAGVLFSNSSGSGSFVVPLYRNTITIEIWGAGGGGGGTNGSGGAKGGDTSIVNYQPPSGGTFSADYTAGGGKGGDKGIVPTPPAPNNFTATNGGRDPAVDVVRFQDGTVVTVQDGKVVGYFDGPENTYKDPDTGANLGLGGPEGNG
jgi:hypothetical protein